MARAKLTDRAEARRRYRMAQAASTESDSPEPEAPDDAPAAAPAKAAAPARPAAAQAAGARPSVMAAFRSAYHPARFREDLEVLPRLLLTRGFLAALGLMVAGTAIVLVQPTGTVSGFVFQTVVLPPALAPVFIAGFFAPRASYLLGFLVGCVDALLYGAAISSLLPQLSPGVDVTGYVGFAVITSPLSGLLFASAAAWYRRFLQATSPNRNAQRSQAARGSKAAQARDGKTRAARTTRPAPKK